MSDFLQFTGDRNSTNEPAAADFIKRLNAQFRANGTTIDAEKFVEVEDRFKHDSPADRWYEALKVDPAKVLERTRWDAFCVAFKDRFKGATPVSKPPGQLEAELARMRIEMGELAKGTVQVGDRQVYVLVDFVDRVRDAVAEAAAGQKSVGLWDFYGALPAVLQEAIGGVIPANWDAMTAALATVPQSKIDVATAQFRVQKGMADQMDELQRRIASMSVAAARITTAAPRIAPASVPAPPAATAPAAQESAPPANQNGGRGPRTPATQAQKDQLRAVLRECVRRTHPDTPAGHALYAADVATWHQKFHNVPRASLQLEVTGFPLTPGASPPCSGECWRCGVGTVPPHPKSAVGCAPRAALPVLETALRSLGGSWLGRVELRPANAASVNVVEVVELQPWYAGTNDPHAAAAEAPEDFVEGLQQ